MPDKEDKAAYGAEEIASWLGRETGHVDVPEDGYGDDEEQKAMLPHKRRKDLGQFFDGLNVEKAMQDKRRQNAVNAIDEAESLRQAINPGGPNATSY